MSVAWIYAVIACLFLAGALLAFALARMTARFFSWLGDALDPHGSALRSGKRGRRRRDRRNELEFHPALLELRSEVIETLAEKDLIWLTDFGAVDLRHDIYGLEVTAIRTKEVAVAIQRVLAQMLPSWRYRRLFYEDQNVRELGWKVIISRDPEDFEDEAWKSRE